MTPAETRAYLATRLAADGISIAMIRDKLGINYLEAVQFARFHGAKAVKNGPLWRVPSPRHMADADRAMAGHHEGVGKRRER